MQLLAKRSISSTEARENINKINTLHTYRRVGLLLYLRDHLAKTTPLYYRYKHARFYQKNCLCIILTFVELIASQDQQHYSLGLTVPAPPPTR